jgi:predicted secreted hydrolase
VTTILEAVVSASRRQVERSILAPLWTLIFGIAIFSTAATGTAAPAASVFPDVIPGVGMRFPQDEGSHPAFRTEWWYLTGIVQDERGKEFGFQVTFFRSRPGIDEQNPSRFAARQLLFAHAAVSDAKRGQLLRDERAARAGFDLATAKEGALDVTIEDWSVRSRASGGYSARVRSKAFSLQFDFAATQPALIHGREGYSQKGPQPLSASYYYTLPQLRTTGTLTIGSKPYQVKGVAWLDHEWSSEILDAQARGWDWVGINLDDGGALMAFQMRNADGQEHWAAATRRERSDTPPSVFEPDAIEWLPQRRWRSPRTGIEYPVEWRVRVGEHTITLRPLMDDQENDARASTGTIYWEGAVIALDETGRSIGRGYLELTGYGQRVNL